jgi:phosphate starvation-inducible protein PhoH and related proteins
MPNSLLTGDITQIDLPRKSQSGLIHALKILNKIKSISVIEFDKKDIVRHRLVRDIVDAYEKKAKAEMEAENNA